MGVDIDLAYEFCAPRFFDFSAGETEAEAAAAERWFTGAVSYQPSPRVGKVKSIQELSSGCSLEEYIEVQKLVARVTPELSKTMEADRNNPGNAATRILGQELDLSFKKAGSAFGVANEPTGEPCTPKEQFPERFVELQSIKAPTNTGRIIPSKYNRSDLHKQAVMKSVKALPSSQMIPAKRCLTGPQKADTTNAAEKQKREGGHLSQVLNTKMRQALPALTISQQFRLNAEKHGCKRQKLEGGRFCQVMNTKTPRAAPSLTIPHEFHFHTDKRANVHKETGHCGLETQAPSSNLAYIPIAEMVQRFQTNLLGEFKSQVKTKFSQKTCLKLTHPKEPMLGTSIRARPPSVKSSAEQEEEMLANMPKFKARPLNKRILKGPTLLPPPRSTPQLPDFQEFNLKTMERALMHKHSVLSIPGMSAMESKEQTCLPMGELDIERSFRIKTIHELEPELATLHKFKARPLDKRIFSSRGDVGVYTVSKRQATIPKEFQFATDLRAQQQSTMMTGQQNREQRMLQRSRFERTIYGRGLQTHSVMTPLSGTSNHYDENQNLNHDATNAKPCEFSLQQIAGEASIIRKPLGEIQQHLVIAQSVHVQRLKSEKYTRTCHRHDQDISNTLLSAGEFEEIQRHERIRKEFANLTQERAWERQVQKAAFPTYLLR